MIASRASRIATLWTLALAASLGTSHRAQAQATKTETKVESKAKAREKAKAATPSGPIDLNSASSEDLQTLPGVGEVTARKIIDGRPHKSVADLAGAGVSASEIAKLKPLVEAKALPTPVDVNADSIEKLETLPGIGPALAKEIIAGRPHAGYESIAKVKGIGSEKLDGLKGRLKFSESTAAAKAKVKVEEARDEEARARTKVAEAKPGMPKAKAAAEEVKAKAKVEEAKVEEKVKEVKDKEIPAPRLAPGTKININTASKEDLDKLFDIGEVKAQAIIDHRAEKKFTKIEDVMEVKGIKEGIFAKIKDFITVK